MICFVSYIKADDTLYFIYNAKNDTKSVLNDFFHKTLSPKTYPCNLCKITYNTFTKKNKWKKYLDNTNYNYKFLYKNQSNYFNNPIIDFPSIVFGNKINYKIVLNSTELNVILNIDSLIFHFENKLSYIKEN